MRVNCLTNMDVKKSSKSRTGSDQFYADSLKYLNQLKKKKRNNLKR